MASYTPTDKEARAISFATKSYAAMKDQLSFVTDRVAFDMVNIVKRSRKNYYGIFDVTHDTVTGQEKYWMPLTETIVETVRKTVDIDSKNFQIYTANEVLPGWAKVQQHVFYDKLKRIRWGPKLNDIIARSIIDGTGILKACKEWDPKIKKWVRVPKAVDRLNFLTDMTADWLTDAPVKMERFIMTPDELRTYNKIWDNVEYAVATKDVSRVDELQVGGQSALSMTRQETPYVVGYEIWGKIPLDILTGKDEDSMDVFDGHIVVSGMGQGRGVNLVVHLIEKNTENKHGLAPYTEVRMRKCPNRWDGRGVPEQLFGAQEYGNMVVNLRKNNAQILQNGLFKAKIGRGITSEVVAQAVAGGIIPVYDMDDLQPLPVQDVRNSSYLDEDRITNWAQRQTFASDAVQGANQPASVAATTATIQDRNSRNAFDLIDEEFGMSFSQFFEDHILPYLPEEYDADEVLRVTGDASDFATLDDAYVNHVVNQQVNDYIKKNVSVPSAEVVDREKKRALDKLKRMGRNRWLKLTKELQEQEYGLEVVVVNERIDRALIVQQLKEMYASAATNPNSKYDPDKIMEETLRLMGLDTGRLAKDRSQSQEELIALQLYGKPSGRAAMQLNAAAVGSAPSPLAGMNAGQMTGNAASPIATLPA